MPTFILTHQTTILSPERLAASEGIHFPKEFSWHLYIHRSLYVNAFDTESLVFEANWVCVWPHMVWFLWNYFFVSKRKSKAFEREEGVGEGPLQSLEQREEVPGWKTANSQTLFTMTSWVNLAVVTPHWQSSLPGSGRLPCRLELMHSEKHPNYFSWIRIKKIISGIPI